MSDAVLVALITAGLTLLGTILTTITTAISNRKKTVSRIDDVEVKLNNHISEEELVNAKQMRIRILRFNDELCRGMRFSQYHFDDILEDCKAYEAFCEKHKDDWKNGKGEIAIEHIREEYKQHMINNDFLK